MPRRRPPSSCRSAAAGCVSGVAAAIKLSRPAVKVIGVEPAGAAAMKASIDAGQVVTLDRTHSIADGLMAVRPGDLTFAHVRRVRRPDRHGGRRPDRRAPSSGSLMSPESLRNRPAPQPSPRRSSGAISIDGPVVAIVSGGNMDPGTLDELRQLVNHSSPLA